METDNLRHALQQIQNAIEGEPSGLKEAWNLLSSHIDEIEATEDKKAPVESTPESFYERFVPYEWNEINQQTKDGILKAMQEHASNERTKAIQQFKNDIERDLLLSIEEEKHVIRNATDYDYRIVENARTIHNTVINAIKILKK